MRYILTVRKPGQPQTYYIGKKGWRCYDARNVAVFPSIERAQDELEYFAKTMKEFRVSIEVLPANVRNVATAILAARPLEEMAA
jgi:hypothetical protein